MCTLPAIGDARQTGHLVNDIGRVMDVSFISALHREWTIVELNWFPDPDFVKQEALGIKNVK